MGRRIVLSAFIICVLAPDAPASSLHFDQIVDADIREQSLDAALLQLARAAEVSIIFPQQLAASLDAPNVSGPATLRHMLFALLAATDLEPQLVDGEVIVIVRRPPPDPATITVVTVARLGPWSEPAGGIEEMLVTGVPVTGSRIRRLDPDSNPQIDIIDREHLELSGQQTLAEILRFLPAVAGNSTSTKVTNGGNGTAMVALRGLPVSNTLILINGRRTVTDALEGRSADLNTIPLGMVERVEVLKDGASAVYGSDAIAGTSPACIWKAISAAASTVIWRRLTSTSSTVMKPTPGPSTSAPVITINSHYGAGTAPFRALRTVACEAESTSARVPRRRHASCWTPVL